MPVCDRRNKGGGPRPVCAPDVPRSKHYSHYGRESWKGAHIVIGCDPHYHHHAPSTTPLPARLHPSRSPGCPDIAARLRSSSAPCSWGSAKDREVAKQRAQVVRGVIFLQEHGKEHDIRRRREASVYLARPKAIDAVATKMLCFSRLLGHIESRCIRLSIGHANQPA